MPTVEQRPDRQPNNPSEPQRSRPQAPRSYPFPQSQDAMLSWPYVVQRLERAHNYWLATVRRDGRPHATPLWGVWVDGALWFDGPPATRWARNMAGNPAVSVHLESDDVVILEGVAEDVEAVADADLTARIVAAWDAKYGRLHPEPAAQGIFRLRPRTARAWSSGALKDGTRFTFE